MKTVRVVSLVFIVALVGAACSSDDSPSLDSPSLDSASPDSSSVDAPDSSSAEDVPSALDAARGVEVSGLPTPLVPLNELLSGGPPPDGIPPIDAPTFLPVGEVDFVADNEPVVALEIAGEARAYPVQIMIWHEIVNDTFGDVPVAVTYCPLCNSALAFDRRVEGRVVTFGTSGMLWNSALVMYDRQTESLWSHFSGDAIAGVFTGVELERWPVAMVPFGAWRDAHPDGLVLSRDTGFDRRYGANPYPGYDDVNKTPFLFEGEVDGRYTAMTRVVGIEVGQSAVAVPLVTLREQFVVAVTVADEDLVVWWQAGTASALDDRELAAGVDVGATGVFSSVLDGTELTFQAVAGGFVDDQTGSTWNLFGSAVDGPLAGSQLEPVAHVDTFWFAWSTFLPDTTVIGG